MNVGSLFSGIGGLDLGLERAGMEVIWQVESDPYCDKVLAKHWPHVKRYGDIKEIDWSEVEPVDLICGGFPCQPVSLAGKRLAQDDERWLWPEVDRCIRALRPRYALLENVPGLLSAGMSDVLGDLAASGYDAEWDCIPAAAVGAPHLRYRVFLVAHPGSGHGRPWGPGRPEHGRQGIREHAHTHVADPQIFTERPRLRPDGSGRKRGGRPGDGSSAGDVPDADPSLRDGRPDEPGREAQGREAPGGDSWWATEPDVGRVAARLPPKLDGGGIDEQVGRAESSAEGIRGRGVPGMWLDSSGAEASSRPERPATSRDPLRAMSCQGRSAGRDAAHQADADMRGVRPGVPAQVFPSAQDLWAGMSERTWPALGDEEMARFWASEPEGVPRVATGVPNRVDRLRGLGNAVVPQVAEWVGRRIMEVSA